LEAEGPRGGSDGHSEPFGGCRPSRYSNCLLRPQKRGKMDADNASKPICDALQGVAYTNDNQVSARYARKRDISATYHVKGADPVILNAIQQGDEFVCIKIDNEGGDVHIL
jgi:Endodeoxyribonuclease RusA